MDGIKVFRLNKPRFRSKVVFVDYDWTMVRPASGGTFPKNVADWEWYSDSVKDVLNHYYTKGFAIVVVTNQSKIWKLEQIRTLVTQLQIPVTVCVAMDKAVYKPSVAIVKAAFSEAQLARLNKEQSFMIGDALGRPNDYSDVDLKFANALGIKCTAPEDVFKMVDNRKRPAVDKRDHQEVVVMVGLPGAGKSTLVKETFTNYGIVERNVLKTPKKMLAAADTFIKEGKSVVFDATNPSKESRAVYIGFAKERSMPVRCVYVATNYQEALARNNKRDTPVPRIVYNVYNKKFEEPKVAEGCEVIVV